MDYVEWYTKCHDIEKDDRMSTLRCIYHDTHGKAHPKGSWQAG